MTPAPYRILFPIGLGFALLGVVPWVLYATGLLSYPGAFHRDLMIQGFETSFVLGFLLTALPGFTHSEKCTPGELTAAVLATALLAAAALVGATLLARFAFLAAMAVLIQALARRLPRARITPPEELVFVAFGLVCGTAGAVLQVLATLGMPLDPVPRFSERLISLGMILSLVLGVGGLLVPVFAGIRNPLVIPGIAGPHQRRGRRMFYGGALAALAFAFVLEATGRGTAAAFARAGAASAILLLVWKILKFPSRRELPAWGLWGSGWLVLAGLWLTALLPGRPHAGLHVVFIGGFGVLTMGVATRVLVAHGGHPAAAEPAVFGRGVATLLIAAMVTRVVAELVPAAATVLWAVAGALWTVAWVWWGIKAMPLVRRVARG